MMFNKMLLNNMFREGWRIKVTPFDLDSYTTTIDSISMLKDVINGCESNKELMDINISYIITSINNINLIDGRYLDDYDIFVYLLDDNTLTFFISTEFLTFLDIPDNLSNYKFIESISVYMCDFSQFYNLLDVIIKKLTYDISDINIDFDFVDKVRKMYGVYRTVIKDIRVTSEDI